MATKTMKTERIQVTLPTALMAQVDGDCEKNAITRSRMVEQILRDHYAAERFRLQVALERERERDRKQHEILMKIRAAEYERDERALTPDEWRAREFARAREMTALPTDELDDDDDE